MTRPITSIAIHCSASPNGRKTTSADINAWHRERGFKRAPAAVAKLNPLLGSIGYHYIIQTDGIVATGRAEAEIGAHVAGNNSKSIGICMIGTDKFSRAQWQALAALVKGKQYQHPHAKILGHRDYPRVAKLCPGFSVSHWVQGGMLPLDGHILETK